MASIQTKRTHAQTQTVWAAQRWSSSPADEDQNRLVEHTHTRGFARSWSETLWLPSSCLQDVGLPDLLQPQALEPLRLVVPLQLLVIRSLRLSPTSPGWISIASTYTHKRDSWDLVRRQDSLRWTSMGFRQTSVLASPCLYSAGPFYTFSFIFQHLFLPNTAEPLPFPGFFPFTKHSMMSVTQLQKSL